MAITLTDDIDTVDISEAEVTKRREPRIAVLSPANRRADIIQGFGTEGFKLDIEGVWVIADSARPDARAILERWRRDNVLVKYDDGSYKAWFTIRSVSSRLVPGAPGNEITAWYSMELSEAIRIQSSTATAGPEDNPIKTQGEVIDDMPTEGTFTTWTQTWTVTDASQVWRYSRVDEVNALVYFLANSRIRSRILLSPGTLGLDSATNDITSGNYLTKNKVDSIQGIYNITVDSADGQKFNVFKNGALLFTSPSLGQTIVVASISLTGKYIAVIAGGSQDRLFLFTGS